MAARFFAAPRGRSCSTCTPDLRRLRNCDGKSNSSFREVWGDIIAQRCPLAEISLFSRRVLRDYVRFRDQGLLPRSGGAGDQDARLMRAVEIINRQLSMSDHAEKIH